MVPKVGPVPKVKRVPKVEQLSEKQPWNVRNQFESMETDAPGSSRFGVSACSGQPQGSVLQPVELFVRDD
jgi:hypothetical protein